MTQPNFPSAKFMGRSYDASAVDEWIAENYPSGEGEPSSNSWPSVEVEPADADETGEKYGSDVADLIAALRDREADDDWIHTALTDQIEALEVSRAALRKDAATAREERTEAQSALAAVDKSAEEGQALIEENESLRKQLVEAETAREAVEKEFEQVQATAQEQAQNVAEMEDLESRSDNQTAADILALRTALTEAENALAEAQEELTRRDDDAAAVDGMNEWDEPSPVTVDTPIDPVMRSVEIITQAEKVASEHIAEAERQRAAIEAEAEERKAALTEEVEAHRAYLTDSVADLEARQDNMFGELGSLIRDAKAFIESTEGQLQERRESMPQDRLTVEQ